MSLLYFLGDKKGTTMKVTLRRKKINNGKLSLYLDIYLPEKGQRIKEYLKLYLFSSPKSKYEKELNKETLLLAESIAAKKLIELQDQGYNFKKQFRTDANFITYFKEQTEKRKNSTGNYGNWDSVLKHLIKHSGNHLAFAQVDEKWVESFKYYLKHDARTKSNTHLSQNSCYSYFNKLKACLRQAHKEKMIPYNPSEHIQGFKQGEPNREFLTLEELQQLATTECHIPVLKSAFIFSTLTGLRWSDIVKLTWSEVHHSEAMGHYLRFIQAKTKGHETLPISNQAFSLLGERTKPDMKVFKGLKYSAHTNLRLAQWVMRAGITKDITFHCARHTYATLQLTLGTDIYTVSKLLGHKELKTTQIYAKIINEKKIEAANIIPNININND